MVGRAVIFLHYRLCFVNKNVALIAAKQILTKYIDKRAKSGYNKKAEDTGNGCLLEKMVKINRSLGSTSRAVNLFCFYRKNKI